jgi:tRNA threonylcarbamoyladenosine biosynthesis protein TsaE
MLRFRVTTEDVQGTVDWGARLARVLRPGDVIGLDGPLGAGKTTLVRSIATALGADARLVASPSYVIAHEYPIGTRASVVHIDAYRLGADDDLEAIGLDRLGERDITIVEWAERLAGALPEDIARIRIEMVGEDRRDLVVELADAWRVRPDLDSLAPDLVRCPATNLVVSPGDPHSPFATERARLADLHGWITERYHVERPVGPDDESLAGRGPAP